MMPVKVTCEECGKVIKVPPCQFKRAKNHFCSRQCHMKFMNREMNPHRMNDPEVREKIRQSQLDKGDGKTYQKCHGRHTHRVVAEQMLGRPLRAGEIVHHIDGNKRNNKPTNLMVFKNQSEHAKWHATHDRG